MPVNTERKRAVLIAALMTELSALDEFGAMVAAAHLQAAIDALRSTSSAELDPSNLE